ncbi:sensor histidine kinase [Massilia dura]|uniref:C4-dicarboxylate transport sensor protein DctB n=1 Tax=Pseudoduganella dura TaxID=321982 RepID=A0A6I3XPX5_9BURK|nr:ATP-binding protein [Pseudoduganella dura]MUI15851.1 sensor histidine kinase [Pseudoduganella dura]GGX89831.1 two-component sensor histidine kinase [Pseudoduganella dura]
MPAPFDNIASPATQAAASPPFARLAHLRPAHLAWCVALAVGVAFACAAYWWTEKISTERLRAAGAQRLEVYAASLENLLDKYDFLPHMLELDKDVLALLEHPGDSARRQEVNGYLERLSRQAGSRIIYIVDLRGRTLAASNWRQKDSFVGDSIGFRPYLRDALRGRPSGFYGVGTTSGEPGYFYARGVHRDGRMLGVAVVKVNIEEQERGWVQGADKVMLADANGVVFLSSAPAWKYHTLRPLSGSVRAHLEQTRQYHRLPLPALPLRRDEARADGTRVVAIGDGAPPLLAQTRSMAPRNWTYTYLSDLSQARANARAAALFACMAYSFLLLLFLYLRQRQRGILQRLQAREQLQEAYDNLELMVAERTARLARTTQSLSDEVEVRRQAEQQLHRTQNELYQAGKMAVLGQMSASITHELNQPLTALRTMSDNAVLLLERGRMDEARQNLAKISQIVARMGGITGKLKSFARKSNAALAPASIHTAIANALVLVERRLELDKVAFTLDISQGDIYALCDINRLEQVLLNLMTNALDALGTLERGARRELSVSVTEVPGSVQIRVRDGGPGLSDEARARLFEPFFTTKPQGEGLGLGLAISEQIIRDFGGSLRAEQSDTGACFIIELKTASVDT